MLTFMDKRIAVFGVFLVAIGGACFAQSPIDADLDGNESRAVGCMALTIVFPPGADGDISSRSAIVGG